MSKQKNKRKHISFKTKLAAALRELFKIPYEHAKLLHEDQILSLVQYDHNVLHAIEVNDHHSNLTPILIAPHREKSKKDTSTVAKVKRIEERWEAFLRGLKSDRPTIKSSRWPKGRKLRSRATISKGARVWKGKTT